MAELLRAWEDGYDAGRSGMARRPPIATRPVRTQYSLGWYAGLNARRAHEEGREEQPPSVRRALEHTEAHRSAARAAQARKTKRAPARKRGADDFITSWRKRRDA